MKRSIALLVFVAAVVVAIGRAQTKSSSSSTVTSETVETVVYRSSSGEAKSELEARNVRVKLSSAEERVKALVSKLDAVSEDASRARLEIHATLTEAWNIVDLLGKDRCGDAVLEVRKKQQTAEETVTRLQSEVEEARREKASLEGRVATLRRDFDDTSAALASESKRRGELEADLNDSQARLKQALAVTSRSETLEVLMAHVKTLSLRLGERIDLLRQIFQHVKVDLQEGEALEKMFEELRDSISSHETEYTSTVTSLKLDPNQVAGMAQRYADLERKLREAMADRTNAVKNLELMQRQFENVKKTAVAVTGTTGRSTLSILGLMLASLMFGAFLVVIARNLAAGELAVKRETAGESPGFGGNRNWQSPGSAGNTPFPRTSPLGRGAADPAQARGLHSPDDFRHSDRSPMTYIRASGSPAYRD